MEKDKLTKRKICKHCGDKECDNTCEEIDTKAFIVFWLIIVASLSIFLIGLKYLSL
jgi:hypothetical protein